MKNEIKHAPGVLCITAGCFIQENNGKVVTILQKTNLTEFSDEVYWDVDKSFDMGVYGLRDYLPQGGLIPIAGPSIDITERQTDEVSA